MLEQRLSLVVINRVQTYSQNCFFLLLLIFKVSRSRSKSWNRSRPYYNTTPPIFQEQTGGPQGVEWRLSSGAGQGLHLECMLVIWVQVKFCLANLELGLWKKYFLICMQSQKCRKGTRIEFQNNIQNRFRFSCTLLLQVPPVNILQENYLITTKVTIACICICHYLIAGRQETNPSRVWEEPHPGLQEEESAEPEYCLSTGTVWSEIEKAGDAGDTCSANFFQLC